MMAQSSSGENLDGREQDVDFLAKFEYDACNYTEALHLLETIVDTKSTAFNRMLVKFKLDNDHDYLLNFYTDAEERIKELSNDQQFLLAYNKALVLAKYKDKYYEAIETLEKMDTLELVDERMTISLCHLLAVLYIERRKEPTKSLGLLQFISEKASSTDSLPPRFAQLKALCYLQKGATKLAKRELKPFTGEVSIRTLIQLQRKNLKKAVKTWSTRSPDCPFAINNEAIVNYRCGKCNTAVHSLYRHLSESNQETVYNLAIMNLFTGNYDAAFQMLSQLIHVFSHNPRLWLRLSECKLLIVRKLMSSCEPRWKGCDMALCNIDNRTVLREVKNSIKVDTMREVKEGFLFVRKCLITSLALLKGNEKDFYPSNYPSESELNRLNITVLQNLSYVALHLDDHQSAYTYALEALKYEPTGQSAILCNMYAGESAIYLEKYDEAVKYFHPQSLHKTVTNGDKEFKEWNSRTAYICNVYNSALVEMRLGSLSKAIKCLENIGVIMNNDDIQLDDDLPQQVIILIIYIELLQGHVERAKFISKTHLPFCRML